MIEVCIEWLKTKIELNHRMVDNEVSDFNEFLNNDNKMMNIIIELLEEKEVTK